MESALNWKSRQDQQEYMQGLRNEQQMRMAAAQDDTFAQDAARGLWNGRDVEGGGIPTKVQGEIINPATGNNVASLTEENLRTYRTNDANDFAAEAAKELYKTGQNTESMQRLILGYDQVSHDKKADFWATNVAEIASLAEEAGVGAPPIESLDPVKIIRWWEGVSGSFSTPAERARQVADIVQHLPPDLTGVYDQDERELHESGTVANLNAYIATQITDESKFMASPSEERADVLTGVEKSMRQMFPYHGEAIDHLAERMFTEKYVTDTVYPGPDPNLPTSLAGAALSVFNQTMIDAGMTSPGEWEKADRPAYEAALDRANSATRVPPVNRSDRALTPSQDTNLAIRRQTNLRSIEKDVISINPTTTPGGLNDALGSRVPTSAGLTDVEGYGDSRITMTGGNIFVGGSRPSAFNIPRYPLEFRHQDDWKLLFDPGETETATMGWRGLEGQNARAEINETLREQGLITRDLSEERFERLRKDQQTWKARLGDRPGITDEAVLNIFTRGDIQPGTPIRERQDKPYRNQWGALPTQTADESFLSFARDRYAQVYMEQGDDAEPQPWDKEGARELEQKLLGDTEFLTGVLRDFMAINQGLSNTRLDPMGVQRMLQELDRDRLRFFLGPGNGYDVGYGLTNPMPLRHSDLDRGIR
tara:strand:+ start:1 stop:1953 length:1953 start_codon:yes stop_codon:yes gene_type:complete